MKNHELLERGIIFAITKVSLEGAALPATVESLGFVVHVAADRITVEKNPKQGMSHDLILPAHLRDGRVWIGTPQQEDAVRARIQEIDEERQIIANSHDGGVPQEADDALALAERSVSRNPLRRLLREKGAFQ